MKACNLIDVNLNELRFYQDFMKVKKPNDN